MSAVLALAIAVLGVVATLVVVVFLWVLRALLVKEAEAAVPALTLDLLRRAEVRLPEKHRPRFQEETQAGLRDVVEKRPLWGLMQAASLYVAALSGSLAAEFEPAAAPARGSSAVRSSAVGWINGLARTTLQKLPSLHYLGQLLRALWLPRDVALTEDDWVRSMFQFMALALGIVSILAAVTLAVVAS